jgi:glucose-1-phosphate thymidylyltransferase
MKIILYETNQVENLFPITLTRAAFEILCGGTNLYDVLKQELKSAKIDYSVREYLEKNVEGKYPRLKSDDNEILFLDSALIPNFKLAKSLKFTKSVVLKNKSQIIGAYLDLGEMEFSRNQIKGIERDKIVDFLKSLKLKTEVIDWPVFEHPWQVIFYNEEILSSNLDFIKDGLAEIKPGVFVGKNVSLPKEIVLDSNHGKIVIESGTFVSPFCHLVGPLYIGKNCTVREFTVLKYNCCFGDVCKVAGEIENSIMQGFSNKNHHGFLGYSYLGEWVNLGAGTTNSNLKNNYGTVKMAGLDTGCMFLGCIIGDYSRTAINSSIYTGKVIGVCSHLYGTIVEDVPSFTHYAKDFGCVIEYGLDQSISLQKTVFARRQKHQQNYDIKLLQKVFESTKKERKSRKIKEGKIFFYEK